MEIMETFNSVLETYNNGATATKNALGFISGARKLVESGHASPNVEIENLIFSAFQEVCNAKEANLDIQDKLIKLGKAIDEINGNQEKFGRYELWETPVGVTVYKLKETHAHGEHMHYICPSCYDNRKKSILQPKSNGKECYLCSNFFAFAPRPEPKRVRITSF